MTEQHALFDTIGDIRVDLPFHHCSGLACTYCAKQDVEDAQAFADIDPQWRMMATAWLKGIDIGGLLNADLLIADIGKPLGHPNQIGAMFRSWVAAGRIVSQGNYVTSSRESNNGRSIRVWKRTA
jgi:hypothetical protein